MTPEDQKEFDRLEAEEVAVQDKKNQEAADAELAIANAEKEAAEKKLAEDQAAKEAADLRTAQDKEAEAKKVSASDSKGLYRVVKKFYVRVETADGPEKIIAQIGDSISGKYITDEHLAMKVVVRK